MSEEDKQRKYRIDYMPDPFAYCPGGMPYSTTLTPEEIQRILPNSWICSRCKCVNVPENPYCFHCGVPRRAEESK